MYVISVSNMNVLYIIHCMNFEMTRILLLLLFIHFYVYEYI